MYSLSQTLKLLGFLSFLSLHSQVEFCPPGARWSAINAQSHWYPGATYNSSIVYVGDSISGTDTLKMLEHSNFYDECNYSTKRTTLIKQKGDTILMKSYWT